MAGGLGLGRFAAGALSSWVGKRSINARAILYHVSVVVSLILLVASLAIDFGTDIGPYTLINLLLGFTLAFDNPIMHPMIARITPPELRSTAYGLWQSGSERLGDVLFTFLVGVLTISMGLDAVLLYLVCGLVFIRVIIWFVIYRTYSTDVARNDAVLANRVAALDS